MKFIAKTLAGLESVLLEELQELGATGLLKLSRAVMFEGDKNLMYKSNLWLRTCLKVLIWQKEFEVPSEAALYNEVKKIPWEDYITPDQTFAVDSVVNSEKYRHSNFIALKAKDAIVDRFREKFGKRPDVDTTNPHLRINIHIRETTCTVSIDSSGDSLHYRGNRVQTVEAPLNEVLAAGLVLLSGWDKKEPLIDPMCGSGTILMEAVKIMLNLPAQTKDRFYAFMHFKDFDQKEWDKISEKSFLSIANNEMLIKGFDIMRKNIQAAKENVEDAGMSQFIQLEVQDFFESEKTNGSTLIFNPPYNERLQESDIIAFYKHIGDKLKKDYTSCKAWILSGHIEGLKNLGLRASSKIKLNNGGIPAEFHKFELYEGSKKAKNQNTL